MGAYPLIFNQDKEARSQFVAALEPHLGWARGRDTPQHKMLDRILASIDDARVPGALIPISRRKQMSFIAVADNQSDWRKLSPLLFAAVGMTLTTFDGRPNRDDHQPISAVLNDSGLVSASFESWSKDGATIRGAVDALLRLTAQLGRAPQGLSGTPRSAAEILHSFDLALTAGNRERALAELDELAARRALDGLNLRFLTARCHAAFGEWNELRSKPWFEELCRARRPPRVGLLLIEALYRVDLGGDTTTASDLRTRFSEHVGPVAGSLFAAPPTNTNPAITTSYLLDALSRDDRARVAELQDCDTSGWEGPLRARFTELLTVSPVPADASPSVVDLYSDMEAFIARNEVFTAADVRAITTVLADDDSLRASRLRQSILERLVRDSPGAFGTTSTTLLPPIGAPSAATAMPEQSIPEDWIEWFKMLPELSFEVARSYAEKAKDEWAVALQFQDTDDIDLFIGALTSAADGSQTKLVSALPHLVDWLAEDELWPQQSLVPLYAELVSLFMLLEERSSDALTSMSTLLEGLVQVGMPSSAYERVCRDLQEEIPFVVADRTLDTLVDLAEVLVTHPCPSPEARLALWTSMVAQFKPFEARMTEPQVWVLNSLSEAYETQTTFEYRRVDRDEEPEESTWTGVIGLYTLREPVGARVKETLVEVLPAATVEVSNAKVATDRLLALVDRADVMAVHWTAAKHAATNAIAEKLGRRSPLWVRGGAATISADVLTAVRKEIDTLT